MKELIYTIKIACDPKEFNLSEVLDKIKEYGRVDSVTFVTRKTPTEKKA